MNSSLANRPAPLAPHEQKLAQAVQQRFGQRLRMFRHKRRMTIEALAEAAGIHPNYLGSVERGERNLSLFNIWRIASALEVDASALLDELPQRAALLSRSRAGK